MSELLEDIGHNVRRLREEKGWNQTELGFHADSSASIVSLIENAKRNPSTATLAKIASALGVEVVDLLPKAPPRPPELGPPGVAYFVEPEEGEEPEAVTLRLYAVQLLEENEPILLAMREASPEEAAKMRQQLENSGRRRE
jgi:transcriptional regulator with XRE-family HTH domain